MTNRELKEIREKISCPQFGDDHYGEWGALTLGQRVTIKRLLDYIESQEQYIEKMITEKEIERLAPLVYCPECDEGKCVGRNNCIKIKNFIEKRLKECEDNETE